jgi:allantoicase
MFVCFFCLCVPCDVCVFECAFQERDSLVIRLLTENSVWVYILFCSILQDFALKSGEVPVTHVRLTIIPDGGVMRLRLLGKFE